MIRKKDKKAKNKRITFHGEMGGKLRVFLILAFAAVYILSMLLATWVDQLGRRNDYWEKIEKADQEIWDDMRYKAQAERISADDAAEAEDNWQIDQLYEELSAAALINSTEYQMLSAAVYDMDGNLAAQSTNLLTAEIENEYGTAAVSWPLSDYLTEKELETLAGYVDENSRPHEYAGITYEIKAAKSEEGNGLEAISVRRLFYSTEDVKAAGNIGPVWQWQNTGGDHDGITYAALNRLQAAEAYFPGLRQNGGIENWQEWMESDYLQNYPEVYQEQAFHKETGSITLQMETSSELFLSDDYYRPEYTLVIRSVGYPWKEAVDSLKYIYLWGGILTVLCAGLALCVVEKTFRRRALLEERQRDFTNAIAHEMKTPLAVIRGFAENLDEDINKEKRKYYLEQIIGQTERMDDMVKEMVYISRLDSEKYTPAKEEISVRALLRGIVDAYSTQLEEKQIELHISCRDDFLIKGEKRFIEKAFSNLIANAVDYNRYEGKIQIDIEKDKCVIQNTGEKIPEEDMPRVCELFFTGSQNWDGSEKHFGIGLYLAEKIFRMHRLRMKIENTDAGVRVTVG